MQLIWSLLNCYSNRWCNCRAVCSTGLSTNLIIVIEAVARDNVIILILLTIVLGLLLGMGLPTTANYVVLLALMSMVLIDVGNVSGYIFPLIVVHLFVFYLVLMADVTPPARLASMLQKSVQRSIENRCSAYLA